MSMCSSMFYCVLSAMMFCSVLVSLGGRNSVTSSFWLITLLNMQVSPFLPFFDKGIWFSCGLFQQSNTYCVFGAGLVKRRGDGECGSDVPTGELLCVKYGLRKVFSRVPPGGCCLFSFLLSIVIEIHGRFKILFFPEYNNGG